jgi:uncharacterized HAD superfamily protein
MKIESTLIFLNVTSPFSVLNGMCTGNIVFQAIIVEDTDGKMFLDSLEELDTLDLTFAGNKLGNLPYKEYNDWIHQVNKLFACDISDLISKDAEANLDKAALEKFAQNIQLPSKSNRNCCC